MSEPQLIRCPSCGATHRLLFPAQPILDVICTYPIVIYRGEVCRNLGREPPEESLGADRRARDAERLLTNIRERERIEPILGEQRNEPRQAQETLVEDTSRRTRAEAELLALRDELAAELTAVSRLHEFSTRLLASPELQPLLEEVLNATIALQNADFGTVQLYNPQTRALEIVAQRGFQQDFLNYFSSAHEDGYACGRALQRRERIIIEDVQIDPDFEPHREIAAAAGFRALQSTPLFSRSGEPLVVLSTHFRQPHCPSVRDLRLTDLYAIQAAQVIESKRAEENLRRSEAYLAEGKRLSHTGSWSWNVSTGEFFWSQEVFRIFGLDPAKTKPSYELFLQWVHPEDRPRVEQTINEMTVERRDGALDCRLVLPDGSMKHLHAGARPVVNVSGGPEYIGVVMDVTERHQATAALGEAFEEIRILKDRLYHENLPPREEIDRTSMFEEIVGSSPAVRAVLSRVAKVAPMDSTVLITGETGTGKELIARAIHKRSKRAGRAFLAFNCAGIPSSLIASELFGHEKGAFTGAQQRRVGRFELAEGGTLFLDEIAELPAETQVALLRVLQEREFERVGGSRPIFIDVRIIAASNRDLQDAIASGTFRLDLFHRLNVFPIEVPPLRERKEDIPILLEYFIKRYAGKASKRIRSIDEKTVELFRTYHWPGNIRELQNVIERSVILSDSELFSVDVSWVAKTLQPRQPSSTLSERLFEHEKMMIESALTESKGRVSGPCGAAAKVGIPSSTLESKIKALKIEKHRFRSA